MVVLKMKLLYSWPVQRNSTRQHQAAAERVLDNTNPLASFLLLRTSLTTIATHKSQLRMFRAKRRWVYPSIRLGVVTGKRIEELKKWRHSQKTSNDNLEPNSQPFFIMKQYDFFLARRHALFLRIWENIYRKLIFHSWMLNLWDHWDDFCWYKYCHIFFPVVKPQCRRISDAEGGIWADHMAA